VTSASRMLALGSSCTIHYNIIYVHNIIMCINIIMSLMRRYYVVSGYCVAAVTYQNTDLFLRRALCHNKLGISLYLQTIYSLCIRIEFSQCTTHLPHSPKPYCINYEILFARNASFELEVFSSVNRV